MNIFNIIAVLLTAILITLLDAWGFVGGLVVICVFLFGAWSIIEFFYESVGLILNNLYYLLSKMPLDIFLVFKKHRAHELKTDIEFLKVHGIDEDYYKRSALGLYTDIEDDKFFRKDFRKLEIKKLELRKLELEIFDIEARKKRKRV